MYPRLKKSPVETKPTNEDNDEIYDEIDTRKEMIAKQNRAKAEETGYEVNIAMETKSSTEIKDSTDSTYLTPRVPSDGSAYEDVNGKRETYPTPRAPSDGYAYEDVNVKVEKEYQGLDLDNVDQEQPYEDLNKTIGDIVPPP